MKSSQSTAGLKALVMVLDDEQSAHEIAETLQSSGFAPEKIEYVTRDVHRQAPEVETPAIHETITSSMIDNAGRWGTIGAGAGILAGLLTPFPGAVLAMLVMGGISGSIVGAMAGVDKAVEDDSVDLPTLDEYEQLVQGGENLLVVLGTHDEILRRTNC